MDDLIRRSDAIKAVEERSFAVRDSYTVKAIIRNVPSADRPKGKWIGVTNGRGGHECSNCHEYAPSYMSGDEHLSDFCPHCGAKMKGADDE